MKEVFKQIIGYEGLYKVSNYGRVYSVPRKTSKGGFLKLQTNKGYVQVGLSKKGVLKTEKVHQLVAKSFLQNINNYPCINHKDENPSNNHVQNLEWCTYKYNLNYGDRTKKFIEALSKKVYQYSKNGLLVKVWKSSKSCVIEGFNQGHISTSAVHKKPIKDLFGLTNLLVL